ncbi:peptidoglycan editing factor PgeF [Marinobacter lutaoensis]|jgi:YfiH family protein|uniref:Purine nucleoside phosphorylase n=1 Tax=Marinobacter lutaoensis TaxID=135739 RepID=A0A1V2DW66_9GAMM|nr:peptidoglycan editing factor PgeF [Marinobacter lutaoensis]MBE03218.1 multi-copper polyphenol oxidoreductase [Marinobacter sp.]MBI44007.1 multi-copper polyphenol oxidoreductase [Oceanospirillales bacterium]NVD35631.1 peptidoglycan editing factor PgeF [Marinobacter lutaoensis]ONF44739.1 multi-copper polyphenol oxidoreductase [Marinobacter lutaoensis]|tara:strand:+ start:330 stop:1085 length:756 start_codon:yes stop_codon:yes gene_type:complete
MISERDLVTPDWPAPAGVRALCTTRQGGVSQPPWNSLNLGGHVGDRPEDVVENRRRLAAVTGLPTARLVWLNQVHGIDVVALTAASAGTLVTADACWTRERGMACAILTADCLPVLLCDQAGQVVGAAHAGWRSLCAGVLERLVTAMPVPAGDVLAWLGPAIGPQRFEVGPEVRAEFLARDPQAARAFVPSSHRPGHYLADLYGLARQRLAQAGVGRVFGGGLCTLSDSERFFSYRRDGQTGRMASLIWLT